MSILTAIILGIIQGLTEFLPISSSGHLVLFQKLFGISESSLLFSTMLHAGTLAAVCMVLWRDIKAILCHLIQPLTLYLLIATVPLVLCVLLFDDLIENIFQTGQFLGFAFVLTAILLAAAQIVSQKNKNQELAAEKQKTMSWKDALFIGLIQVIAIIPGVSRSGATISGALFRKIDRDLAARFSFLLSIPAILGALLFQIINLIKNESGKVIDDAINAASGNMAETALQNSSISAWAIIAGTLSAAIVGFFAVRFMLKIIREKSLWGFVIYTSALGIFILLDQFWLHLLF